MRARVRRLTLAIAALATIAMAGSLDAAVEDECAFCVSSCPSDVVAFCVSECPDVEPWPVFPDAECVPNRCGPGQEQVICIPLV